MATLGVISGAVNEALSGEDEWPTGDVVLYEPCENEQSLMYEFAECLSVRTLLKMCKLPYRVEHRPNAQFMSPSGSVPFLRIGRRCVADFTPINETISRVGLRLSADLDDLQLAEMHAHMCAVQETLKYAEMWLCWCHPAVKRNITSRRYGSVYPWPLNMLLTRQKSNEINHILDINGWQAKTVEQVLSDVDVCCHALSVKLGDNDYFCMQSPTELDAVVFGHIYTILTTELSGIDVAIIVKKYDNLYRFVQRIDNTYFKHKF